MAARSSAADFAIRAPAGAEEDEAMALVRRVFEATIRPLLVQEGIDELLRYAQGDAYRERAINHRLLVATPEDEPGRIVGMAESRDDHHLSLLFVDLDYQRRGLARRLVDAVIALCRERDPDLPALSVNSSPNSIAVYEHLGFVATDVEQCVKGVRFVPMILRLPRTAGTKDHPLVIESTVSRNPA